MATAASPIIQANHASEKQSVLPPGIRKYGTSSELSSALPERPTPVFRSNPTSLHKIKRKNRTVQPVIEIDRGSISDQSSDVFIEHRHPRPAVDQRRKEPTAEPIVTRNTHGIFPRTGWVRTHGNSRNQESRSHSRLRGSNSVANLAPALAPTPEGHLGVGDQAKLLQRERRTTLAHYEGLQLEREGIPIVDQDLANSHSQDQLRVDNNEDTWGSGHTPNRASLYYQNVKKAADSPNGFGKSWFERHGSSLPQPVPDSLRKLQESIFELIETERNFLLDMQLLHISFISESGSTYSRVFWNLEEIMLHSRDFVKVLVERQERDDFIVSSISDILLSQVEVFSCYALFCSRTNEAIEQVRELRHCDPRFRELMKTFDQRSAIKLPLETYLLKPMQRVTRYPLLIQAIWNRTSDMREKRQLQVAYEEFENLCDLVNEKCRQQDYARELEKTYQACQRQFPHINLSGRPIKVYRAFTMSGETHSALMTTTHLLVYKSSESKLTLVRSIVFKCVMVDRQVTSSFKDASNFMVLHPPLKRFQNFKSSVFMMFPAPDYAQSNAVARYMAVVETGICPSACVRLYCFQSGLLGRPSRYPDWKVTSPASPKISRLEQPGEGPLARYRALTIDRSAIRAASLEKAEAIKVITSKTERRKPSTRLFDVELDLVDILRPSFTFQDEILELTTKTPSVYVVSSAILEATNAQRDHSCYTLISVSKARRRYFGTAPEAVRRMPDWKCAGRVDHDTILLGCDQGMFALSISSPDLVCILQKQFARPVLYFQLFRPPTESVCWCLTLEGKEEKVVLHRLDTLHKSIKEKRSVQDLSSTTWVRELPNSAGTKSFRYFCIGDRHFLLRITFGTKLPKICTVVHYIGGSHAVPKQESLVVQDRSDSNIIISISEHCSHTYHVFRSIQTFATPVSMFGSSAGNVEALLPRQDTIVILDTNLAAMPLGYSFLLLDIQQGKARGVFDSTALRQASFPQILIHSPALGIGSIGGDMIMLVYEDYGLQIHKEELLALSRRRVQLDVPTSSVTTPKAKVNQWDDSVIQSGEGLFHFSAWRGSSRKTGIEVWHEGFMLLPGLQVVNAGAGWVMSPVIPNGGVALQSKDASPGAFAHRVSRMRASKARSDRQILFNVQLPS